MNTVMIDAKKRRDKISIIAEILEISKNGTLKTQIMYRANLSFAQLNDYLKFLINTDLLKQISDDGKDVYFATAKGLDFLKQYYDLSELLNEKDFRSNVVKVPPRSLLK